MPMQEVHALKTGQEHLSWRIHWSNLARTYFVSLSLVLVALSAEGHRNSRHKLKQTLKKLGFKLALYALVAAVQLPKSKQELVSKLLDQFISNKTT